MVLFSLTESAERIIYNSKFVEVSPLRVQFPARIFVSNLRLFSQSPLQPFDPPRLKSSNSSSVFPYPSRVAISSLLSPFWFPLRRICLPRLERMLKTINKEIQTQQVKRLLPFRQFFRFFIPLQAHLTWYPKKGDFCRSKLFNFLRHSLTS